MNPTRRTLGALAAATLAAPAIAQGRTVRLVVGFPPGGSTDTVARIYSERLRGILGVNVVVENRPGAGGRLVVEQVKAGERDGTLVLLTPASILTVAPQVFPRTTRYDAFVDLQAVAPVCVFSYALCVRNDHPARTLADFQAWGRAQRDPIPYSSAAAGSSAHFAGTEIARALGLTMTHVPYRGTAPAIQDVLAGNLPVLATIVTGDAAPHHRGGAMRILGVTAPRRLPTMPEVPTIAEQGHPDLVFSEWFALYVPAGTPDAMVAGLSEAVYRAAETPEVQAALTRLEYEGPFRVTPAQLQARLREERDTWTPIVQRSGFRPEE